MPKTYKTKTIILKIGQSWKGDNFKSSELTAAKSPFSQEATNTLAASSSMFPFCFLLQFFSFSPFLYFLFTSVSLHAISPLALADCFSTLSPRLHAKDTFARYLPHLRAYFFLRCSLIGRLWSSFCQQYFWCHTTFRFFLYLIQL